MLSIEFREISKRYRIGRKLPSIREALTARRLDKPENYHWALKGVSFELQPGEALGIMGPNGAGKTTILKILSRVTNPTSGQMTVNGRMSALIELGAGFHPDLTGRENIYLNGAILGMKKTEIKTRFDEIVEFAGIGHYLDTPVKRYSSGMYARLGFAIAAHVDPEVLLIDEVLAVGDYAFQQKCFARMDTLRERGTSLILVAHNFDAIRRVCSRGLVLYRGRNVFDGSAAEAVVAYSDKLRQAARHSRDALPVEEGLSQKAMSFDAEIENVMLLNAAEQPITLVGSGETVKVAVDILFRQDVDQPILALTVRTHDGHVVYDNTTQWMNLKTPRFHAGETYRVEFTLSMNLLEGEFELGVDIASPDLSHYFDRIERALIFGVRGRNGAQGLVDLEAQIQFKKMSDRAELNEQPAS